MPKLLPNLSAEKRAALGAKLPLVAGMLLALVVVGAVGWKFLPRTTLVGDEVIVFDVLKYGNAQRAVASRMLASNNPSEQADIAVMLSGVSKQTAAAVAKVAGGRTVLVKQAVVSGNVLDITDDVLRELGLPTDAPTAGNLAPLPEAMTGSTYDWLMDRERGRSREQAVKNATGGDTGKLLP